jgi:hypothetical protein
MSSAVTLSQFWERVQRGLFGWLEAELGELSGKQKQLVKILELLRVEDYVPRRRRLKGRPLEDRKAIARAFVAKAVYNLETTRQLLERIGQDSRLRRICGWERLTEVPSEATFSRAFAEFAASELPGRVHEAVVAQYQRPRLVGHISRDATAITGREKASKKVKVKAVKGEPTRLQRQASMTLAEMLADLPCVSDCGARVKSCGNSFSASSLV